MGAVVVKISDASFCKEMEDIRTAFEGGFSQQGHVVCLATAASFVVRL